MKTSDVKAEYIKTRIAQMLKAGPKLTFRQAWTPFSPHSFSYIVPE